VRRGLGLIKKSNHGAHGEHREKKLKYFKIPKNKESERLKERQKLSNLPPLNLLIDIYDTPG
jgi:hypothetical protein